MRSIYVAVDEEGQAKAAFITREDADKYEELNTDVAGIDTVALWNPSEWRPDGSCAVCGEVHSREVVGNYPPELENYVMNFLHKITVGGGCSRITVRESECDFFDRESMVEGRHWIAIGTAPRREGFVQVAIRLSR